MCVPIEITSILIGTHLITVISIKTTPGSASTLTGHLTTTDTETIEEATLNITTPLIGRNAHTLNSGHQHCHFIWIIAAVRRDCPTIRTAIHHIAAATELEARRTLSRDHVCFFAGRIRLEVAA
ncbi:host cell division inhibitor Icd-like protein [Lonsdalea quercina]|uniref:host cell division inhibitor Icd-like protein n=1 Tax=Lonsdalea quercina TaxID=71657 RepID=UPI003F45CA6E